MIYCPLFDIVVVVVVADLGVANTAAVVVVHVVIAFVVY